MDANLTSMHLINRLEREVLIRHLCCFPCKDEFDSGDENDVYTIQKSDLHTIVKSTQNLNDLKEKFDDEEEEHLLKINITIAAGFPAEFYADLESGIDCAPSQVDNKKVHFQEDFEKGDGKRLQEGLKPQNYYKFEYQLVPDEQEPVTSCDLVTYKIAAKLYPENQEAKLIKTWENDTQIWVSWTQTHEIKITKSRLLKLFNHEFTLKIWDSKEYCQPRTKFDKIRSIKFPVPKSGESSQEDEVKQLIVKQCKSYLASIPKEFHDKIDRPLPNQQKPQMTKQVLVDPQTQSVQLTNTVIAMSTKPVGSQRVGNKLTDLAADTELIRIDQQHRATSTHKTPTSALQKKSHSRSRQTREKSRATVANDLDEMRQNGVRQIRVKFKLFFTGTKVFTARLETPCQRVEDCLVTINLEKNLMSDRQMELLNPFTIKIEKINDLPDKPLSYDELRDKCEPVYCSYQFCKEPVYRTIGKSHSKSIYYNDTNVYLAGLMDQDEFREYLYGAPFEIEVHDRDRKQDTIIQTPCLFGNDSLDDHISNVNAVATQKTDSNPFDTRNRLWDPCGVAKLSLYEFLLGKRMIQYFVPICPCSAPDSLGRATSSRHKTSATPQTETNLAANVNNHTAPGAYLDFTSCLYVTIALAKPLESVGEIVSRTRAQTTRASTGKCAFGRIVFMIDADRKNLVFMIFSLVKEINSMALNLHEYSESVRAAALSTYKLSADEQKSKTLDIVTGFHVFDSNTHIIILEGLKDLAIKQIYDRIPREKNDGIKFLYNSQMNFAVRLYSSLDVDLIRVKLFEPLAEIVKKPLLYVRDMAPKPSVDALIRLYQMMSIDRLRDVTRCDIFPSAEMIVSMSREFGAALTQAELNEFKELQSHSSEQSSSNQNYHQIKQINFDSVPHASKVWTPLENTNEKYEIEKSNREKSCKNFIKTNLEFIHLKSETNKSKNADKSKDILVIQGPFNYSVQKLNATQMAIEQFRTLMHQEKGFYSYNPEFHHSMTFSPVTLEQAKEKELEESREKMISYHKWTYPDVKSSAQSNTHVKRPDSSTIEKLKQPWIENEIHANKLKPTLQRDVYSWHERNKDFNTWSSSPHNKSSMPVTIFDAGDTKRHNEKRVSQSAKDLWHSKVIVDNLDTKVHRVLVASEMITSGASSSNQLDKLQGLLKDKPMKKGLDHRGSSIPALSVLNERKDFCDENKHGYVPGDSFRLRITDHLNRIPIKNSQRDEYQADKSNGVNFSTLVQPFRPKIHKRRAEPLRDDEKTRFKLPSFIISNQQTQESKEFQLGVNGNFKLVQSS